MLRAVFAICLLCFALAAYSGHSLVSEIKLYPSGEPSPVPGMHSARR
jgi:hypothetical protein